MTVQFLGVKNFEKHQHYKDRDPVWIKFYVAVLSEPTIIMLCDAAQAQLFKFWLLASRHANRIPFDLKYVRKQIKPSGKLYLAELLASGLLYQITENASKTLDESYALTRADAGVAVEEEEVRGKREEPANNTTTTARAFLWTAGEIAVFALLPENRHHHVQALFANWREGLGMPGGKAADERDISAALLEYLHNHETPDFRAAHMVSYVVKARDRRLKSDGPPKQGRGGSFLEVA